MKSAILCIGITLVFVGCAPATEPQSSTTYFDNSNREDVLGGGTRMISIDTPAGSFRVWSKRVGNNPVIKVLLLHGGPGVTHEYLEAFDSYFPAAEIEYYYYDQLGSLYSDQPNDLDLYDPIRVAEEVEQVRIALNLGKENFYLFGHSWGGAVAIEYALKYQQHIKGLIISNMMASMPEYYGYAESTLMPAMDQAALVEMMEFESAGDYQNPRYLQLLFEQYHVRHFVRIPIAEWPDPVNRAFQNLNTSIYVSMQGPSELTSGGLLAQWDRTDDLDRIHVPTLLIGAGHDSMDPEHIRWMASEVQNGRFHFCPDGGHLTMYDDQTLYFDGLIKFVKDVDAGRF